MTKPLVGRFAPSPTGRMHAGNIFAALMAWLIVKASDGRMVLRIEDLDPERSKPCFADAVQRDFALLGLTWDEGPFFQSTRQEAHAAAFEQLSERCDLYPCFCTRADLASLSAPHWGEKRIYPGTCRHRDPEEIHDMMERGEPCAWRIAVPHERISFDDLVQGKRGQVLDEECGDFIVRRKDGAFAYQLAVVIDDAEQGVTSVTRGIDLLSSTPQQIFLARELGYEVPEYAHVPLLVSEDGRRLSKRDADASLDEMLARFRTPSGVIGHIAFVTGLIPQDEPVLPEDILASFDVSTLPALFKGQIAVPWH